MNTKPTRWTLIAIMAYAALSSLQKSTDLILNHDKYSISVDETEQIASIREYASFLISFLEDLPEKANRLEGKIRDLAHEAEDLIEYFMWNQSRMRWGNFELSRVEVECQLKRVREEIGKIAGDMTDDRPIHLPAAISATGVAARGKLVIGLEGDLTAIKGRLCGGSSKLEIIPIVGMGGIGKTTLALNAYDDHLVMEYFHIRVFVQLSQEYDASKFLSKLLASIKLFEEQMLGEKNGCTTEGNECEEPGIAESECNESEIAENVYKCLKGWRYLILIDDLWSTNVWDDVRNIFPNDNNGSRIMLTTRLPDVATYASSGGPVHEMKFMDENQSWNLLKQKVFTEGKDCPPELEDVGKEIARGCRGLPLAVVLVAGILSTVAKSQPSWEKIARNVNAVVDGQLDKILSLSYAHLPHHLRPCFLFMAGFPEDHNIHVSRLIKLWVAEGFLRHQDESKSLEEGAEEYVEDLEKMSLVLITSRKSNGNIKSCRLHDLVRDMCTRKAAEEKFLVTGRYVLPNWRKDERRISIGHSRLHEIQSPTIHTIIYFPTFLDFSSLLFLVRFRLLRVLEILHHNFVLLPLQLFELFHLRYLALGFRDKIPAAISNLENLQTLIIHLCRRSGACRLLAEYLPVEIWKMPHLRNIVLSNFYMLPDPADGSTLPLQNLQTLSGIASFVCSERILKMIPNLRKLGIIYFRNDYKHHDVHNLVNLHRLDSLKITTQLGFAWQAQFPAFPLTLKKLTLVGGRLPWKNMSIIVSLPNLEVLKLRDFACNGTTWETLDGEFTQLKFLLIDGSYLRYWITKSVHFPRLRFLMLHRCQFLRKIPKSFGEIPTLELIEVDTRYESLVNSAKQIQEDQRSYGNDALQVHCQKTVSHQAK